MSGTDGGLTRLLPVHFMLGRREARYWLLWLHKYLTCGKSACVSSVPPGAVKIKCGRQERLCTKRVAQDVLNEKW